MGEIRKLQREISFKVTEVKKEGEQAVKEKLKELKLDGLVKRKSDGKIGKLEVLEYYELRFYPLKKNLLPSEKASGYVWEVEEEFEPY